MNEPKRKPRKPQEKQVSESNNEEIWRDIPGYEPYQVSNLGNIRNPKTGTILKQYAGYQGREYYRIPPLIKDGHQNTADVHRLSALAFLGKPPVDRYGITYFVNHKDGNKWDNRIENLEYVTTGENTAHYHAEVRPARLEEVAKSLGLKTWRQVEFAIIRGEIQLMWITEDADEHGTT